MDNTNYGVFEKIFTTKIINYFFLLTAFILIMLITLISYYPAFNYEFVWDDLYYLSRHNPYIQQINWHSIQWMLTTSFMSNWHPLTWLSFAIDYSWQGSLNPFWFHLTNIVLHGLNSTGIFFITILLINIIKNNSYNSSNSILHSFDQPTFWTALIAAILFSIHPQHIESVAWISQRKDVLSLFFIILTISFYLFYARFSTNNWYWYAAAILCFLLALMSKPTAVTLPIILVLLDIYPLQRAFSKRIILEKIPFFILTTISILLTLFAQSRAIISLEELGIHYRIINAFHSAFLYISKFLFPIALSPFYPPPEHLTNPNWLTFTPIIGFFLVTILSIYYWRKNKKYILTAWLFYLVTLSPMIGIIQVGGQSSADRYAYLPTVPFYILFGSGFVYFYQNAPYNSKVTFFKKIFLIICLAFICLTIFKINQNQLKLWKNDLTFWHHVIKLDPSNYTAHHNLAVNYLNIHQNYIEALKHTQLAIQYESPWQLEQGMLAEIFIRLGRFDEALDAYYKALDVDPNMRKDCIYYNISVIYAQKGQFSQAKQAIAQIPITSPEFTKSQALTIEMTMLEKIPVPSNLSSNLEYSLCFKQLKLEQ